MDLILDRFLTVAGDTLDEDEARGIERLLDQPDQDLFDWVAGRSAPPDPALAALVDRIRSASSVPAGG